MLRKATSAAIGLARGCSVPLGVSGLALAHLGNTRPSSSSSPGVGAASDSHAQNGPQSISIDRSGLYNPRDPTVAAAADKEPETDMVKHIKAMIQFRGGPITMAEYMKEVLTNPIAGFYMGKDVIGSSGNFVTSPEVSQMFGELVGIWTICTWQQMGCPEKLRIVELGPGKGTLMADLIRGTKPFQPFQSAIELHMVEVGTEMRKLQWKALECEGEMPEGAEDGTSSIGGAHVAWHRSLEAVPTGVPAIYIAHEFLDALPVHQFQRSERGWVERLIDIASDDSPIHFRFVLSPTATPASKLILERRLQHLGADATKYDQLEIGALTMSVGSALASRVASEGGAALLVDYGQDAPYDSSVQGIRQHRLVPVLERPGEVDLSAWVDFSSVRQAVEETDSESGRAATHGPVSQAHFLRSLGIDARLESLLKGATAKQAAQLKQGFARLLGSAGEGGMKDGMGKTYKAMAITHGDLPIPVAFEPVEEEDSAADKAEKTE